MAVSCAGVAVVPLAEVTEVVVQSVESSIDSGLPD